MLSSLYTSLPDDLFFYHKTKVKKKFSNTELLIYQFIASKTKICPKAIIIVKNIIFVFVSNEEYFRATTSLPFFRKHFRLQKLVLVRDEQVFVKLLFGFFPDPYIHDVKIVRKIYSGALEVDIGFLSFEERGIAIGSNGNYIKAVNELFEKYVIFEDGKDFSLRIKCKVIKL